MKSNFEYLVSSSIFGLYRQIYTIYIIDPFSSRNEKIENTKNNHIFIELFYLKNEIPPPPFIYN